MDLIQKSIHDHINTRKDHLVKSFSNGPEELSVEEFNKRYGQGYEVYSDQSLQEFQKAVVDEFQKSDDLNGTPEDYIQKAREGLVKKTITNKSGKKQVVWVRPGQQPEGQEKQKKTDQEGGKKEKTEDKDTGKEKKQPEEEDKGKDKQQAGAKKLIDKFKNWTSEQRSFFDTGEHSQGSETRSKAEKFIRGKVQGIIKGIKHEVHEVKDAGKGLAKFFKGEKLSEHEQKAIKAVAIHVGLTVGTMVATGGTGVLAKGLAKFAGGLAIHYLEHAGLMTVGKALAFAKGDQKITEDEALERFVNDFASYLGNSHLSTSDWNRVAEYQKQVEEEAPEESDVQDEGEGKIDDKKSDKQTKKERESKPETSSSGMTVEEAANSKPKE